MNTQNYEQQLSLYNNIKIYCGIAALIFLLLAIILFFALKIPGVFAELTGKKARRAVQEMTDANPKSGTLQSSRLDEDGKKKRKWERTEKLASRKLPGYTGTVIENPSETVCGSEMETEVLSVNETSLLQNRNSQVSSNEDETMVLEKPGFVIVRSIIEIHTEEVIDDEIQKD